jgi:hypothetical protein
MPHRDLPEEPLLMYAIYRFPADYPGDYVVRIWEVRAGQVRPGPLLGKGKDLAEARTLIPPDTICVERATVDDPVIVETWL